MKIWINWHLKFPKEIEVEEIDGVYYYQGKEIDIPIFISRKDALEDKIIQLETELIVLKAENERVKSIEKACI